MRLLAVLVGIILLVGALWFTVATHPPSAVGRVTVAVASSPMAVWSWDTSDNSFTVLAIPSDYFVHALYGYGEYSLEALWKLGFIDKRGGTLLSDSMSDTLGIPIRWYIGVHTSELQSAPDTLAAGKQLFSLSHLFAFIGRRYQTNMPLGTYIAFSRALSATRPDKINSIDLTNATAINEEREPDGSLRKIISPDLLDHALSGVFEQTNLRSEALSVAVYNTTTVPSLGNRASRLLTNAGILVIAVGNDEPEMSSCELSGGEKPLSSKTAAYILTVFGCRKNISEDDKRADLTIRLGTDFAKRFTSVPESPRP